MCDQWIHYSKLSNVMIISLQNKFSVLCSIYRIHNNYSIQQFFWCWWGIKFPMLDIQIRVTKQIKHRWMFLKLYNTSKNRMPEFLCNRLFYQGLLSIVLVNCCCHMDTLLQGTIITLNYQREHKPGCDKLICIEGQNCSMSMLRYAPKQTYLYTSTVCSADFTRLYFEYELVIKWKIPVNQIAAILT